MTREVNPQLMNLNQELREIIAGKEKRILSSILTVKRNDDQRNNWPDIESQDDWPVDKSINDYRRRTAGCLEP